MTLNLHLGARQDERFHLQPVQPEPHVLGWRWLVRRVSWANVFNPDGSEGKWISWTVLWFLHFYHGTSKCDATRTFMYRNGQLGDPHNQTDFVMTTTPKEMLALRLRKGGMDATPVWTNMGGA